jgi:LAO/AO transport system kinase
MRRLRPAMRLRQRPEAILTLDAVRTGGKAVLARALAQLETLPDAEPTVELLNAAYAAARAQTIGLTGPPGVGKSTLTSTLIERWRAAGHTVGVIAVDPSSKVSGGALLGDRMRLRTAPGDAGVFVRSMAARDRLGGLADLTVAAMVLMRAVFDVVLVETVGVGQSETDVRNVVDTVVLCIQPGSGDSLQFMKAGIVEIPDIIVVTKTDMGASAAQARADLAAVLDLREGFPGDWSVEPLGISAFSGEGIAGLVAAVGRHYNFLGSILAARRHAQAVQWLASAIKERWGTEGLRKIGKIEIPADSSPFQVLRDVGRLLK